MYTVSYSISKNPATDSYLVTAKASMPTVQAAENVFSELIHTNDDWTETVALGLASKIGDFVKMKVFEELVAQIAEGAKDLSPKPEFNMHSIVHGDSGNPCVELAKPKPFKPLVKDPIVTLSERCAGLKEKVPYPANTGRHDMTGMVSTVVMYLNDEEKWTREQIADWLDTLDIDLSIDLGGEE